MVRYPMRRICKRVLLHSFTKVILCLFVAGSEIVPEELWNHINETTSQGYDKKTINLALQVNYVHFDNIKEDKPLRILVMITPGGSFRQSGQWYYEAVAEKFNPQMCVLDYRTIDTRYTQKAGYQKARLRGYLRTGDLAANWPPLYVETAEIKYELGRKTYTGKYLLLTGNQSEVLLHSELMRDFDKVILVSPGENLQQADTQKWQGRQVLWVGANHEKEKLASLQGRFGGTVLTYERPHTGQNLLLQNQAALDDILSWVNK